MSLLLFRLYGFFYRLFNGDFFYLYGFRNLLFLNWNFLNRLFNRDFLYLNGFGSLILFKLCGFFYGLFDGDFL